MTRARTGVPGPAVRRPFFGVRAAGPRFSAGAPALKRLH
jgi:hypothetical protein